MSNDNVITTLRKAHAKCAEESDAIIECYICEEILGHACDNGSCERWMERLVAKIIDDIGDKSGAVPVPRYEDGAVVEPGSVSYWGTVEWVDVEVSDNGWGNWLLHIAETSEIVDGTLSQRVPRGLLVDGKPAKKGDKLWFGGDEVTVDGICDGHIMTDYTTTDTEGEEIAYPFEPSELSWEKPEEPDTMERIRADAVKPLALYWGCCKQDCCECPLEPTPKERYGVNSCYKAMQLDIIRRTEEVCKR